MDDVNPYAPPQTDPTLAPEEGGVLPLASRGSRLVAVIVDGIIVWIVLFVVQWLTSSLEKSVTTQAGGATIYFRTNSGWQWELIAIAIWAVVNWIFLQNGQTIGKRLLKLQVQRKSGAKADVMRLVVHRTAMISLLAMIPWIGWLIAVLDALMIFREERNTLHDDIADTKVVKLPG